MREEVYTESITEGEYISSISAATGSAFLTFIGTSVATLALQNNSENNILIYLLATVASFLPIKACWESMRRTFMTEAKGHVAHKKHNPDNYPLKWSRTGRNLLGQKVYVETLFDTYSPPALKFNGKLMGLFSAAAFTLALYSAANENGFTKNTFDRWLDYIESSPSLDN